MPPAFTCEFCGDPVEPQDPATFQRRLVWMPNRKSHSPALPGPPNAFAHYGCIEIEKRSPIERQSGSLF